MRKVAGYVGVVLLLCLLASCSSTLKGTDALMEKARQELAVSDAETIELQYAGQCESGDAVLMWFISGNAYQAHSYLPMECQVTGPEEYRFVRTYRPMEPGRDIAALDWKDGYCFVVNAAQCTTIEIRDRTGTHKIAVTAYPFVYFHPCQPSRYRFLDATGEEL